MREMSIEEAQERFLNLFAQYHLAYSSYYVVRASGGSISTTPASAMPASNSMMKGGGPLRRPGGADLIIVEGEEDGASDNTTPRNGDGNKDSFLGQHMNQDLLCVVNYNGICFYENQKRDKIIYKIPYDELHYAMGNGVLLRLGYSAKSQ